MAKITDYEFIIKQERVKIPIYYTTKRKFYAKNVPSDVLAFQNLAPSGFDKEMDLYRFLQESISHYHEQIKAERLVLAYRLSMTTNLRMNKIEQGHWQGDKPWIPADRSRYIDLDADGNGFAIEWKTLLEVSAKKMVYYELNEDGTIGYEVSSAYKYIIIEWTQEREDAFVEIDNALEQMVKKISGVLFNKDKTKFMLDNKIKLLGEYNKNETT